MESFFVGFVVFVVAIVVIGGVWSIASALQGIAQQLHQLGLLVRGLAGALVPTAPRDGEPGAAGYARGPGGRAPGLADKLDELIGAVWALQSLADAPARPPYRFDAERRSADRALRTGVAADVDAYLDMLSADAVPAEVQARYDAARPAVGGLFGEEAGRLLASIDADAPMYRGRIAHPQREGDASSEARYFAKGRREAEQLKAILAARLATDREDERA